MHTIRHRNITAQINPLGAELSSLKNNEQEMLWQGDERFWSGRAPILFPIVGSLKNNQTTIDGKNYQMPRHGIARSSTFESIETSNDSSVGMQLQANTDSKLHYPWQFELQVHFTLRDNGIDIRYDVFNHDNNTMLFTIGSHPAFALAVNSSTAISDYDIQFSNTEHLLRHRLNEAGLLDTETQLFEAKDNVITLSENIFNDDALVFRNIKSDTINLRCKQQTLLSVNTGGAPHLGLWAKPNAPYVCIEPWLGTSDFVDSNGVFEAKSDLQSLAPGEKFSHQIGINFP